MPGKRLLHIGVSAPPPDNEPPGITTESIHAAVNSGAEKVRAHAHEIQLTYVELETFDDSLDALRKELATGKWDALIVGGGLRTTRSLTPQFERVVMWRGS